MHDMPICLKIPNYFLTKIKLIGIYIDLLNSLFYSMLVKDIRIFIHARTHPNMAKPTQACPNMSEYRRIQYKGTRHCF